MIIRSCKECPFRQRPVLSGVMALFGAGTDRGFCGYDAESDSVVVVEMGAPESPSKRQMMRRAAGRKAIEDINSIPPHCPLRTRNIVVTLGN
jgi:hypothetical protein